MIMGGVLSQRDNNVLIFAILQWWRHEVCGNTYWIIYHFLLLEFLFQGQINNIRTNKNLSIELSSNRSRVLYHFCSTNSHVRCECTALSISYCVDGRNNNWLIHIGMSFTPLDVRPTSYWRVIIRRWAILPDEFLRMYKTTGSGYGGLKVFLQPSGSVRLGEGFWSWIKEKKQKNKNINK